jgi:hypothetical protein
VFHYFRGGTLFLAEIPPIVPTSLLSDPEAGFYKKELHNEYFWLCAECARSMTITLDRKRYALVAASEPASLAQDSR